MSLKAVRLSSVSASGSTVKKDSPERTRGFNATVGDLPVGGVVVPEREQIGVGELSHVAKLRTAARARLA